MVKRNPNFEHLTENYLFPEVIKRVKQYQKNNPNHKLLSLSIGDTSEPLIPSAIQGLAKQVADLATREGYKGYGAEQGDLLLRERIAHTFYSQGISAEEIFISDGAKCDLGRLRQLFGSQATIAVQDPTYPVYQDTHTILAGSPLVYLPCNPENQFFPLLSQIPQVDLIYICSPNNPTGSVATRDQLSELVNWAHQKRAFIIFDAAYAGFISDPHLPRSIFEIAGAKEVAIEVSSFSKFVGFTGIRLGWTVIPQSLSFETGHSVHKDFTRLITTFFNGASVIAQAGGYAALSPEGLREMESQIAFYKENARLIKKALQGKCAAVYGGEHAPYLWAYFGKYPSWDLFQTLLETAGIITTPGVGFGTHGEGFLRFSAFGSRPHILQAIERIDCEAVDGFLI